MTLRRPPKKQIIDLAGPQGNAHVLLGTAEVLYWRLGNSHEATDALIAEMKSADYLHLVLVFDREFGEFFDLIMTPDLAAELDKMKRGQSAVEPG